MQLKSQCLSRVAMTRPYVFRFRVALRSLPLLLAFLLVSCARQEVVPWEALVSELGSKPSVADLTSPHTTIATSHDRSGGNDDYSNGFHVEEDGWLTLTTLKGPGVMTRFWFTGIKGTSRIRFLFDGESEPRFEATASALYAGLPPFKVPLCRMDQYCFTSYLPIPYKRGLRVQVSDDEYSKGKGKLYFQINAMPFARRSVESAVFPVPAAVNAAIGDVERRWSTTDDAATGVAAVQTIASGERVVVGDLQGGGVIRRFRLEVNDWGNLNFENRCRLLSDLWIEAYWDGAEQPSIRAPLGAFCGVMWQPLSYHSMFLGADKGAFFNRFPMPFRSNARFEVFNASKEAVALSVDLQHAADVVPKESAYFHCGWSRSGAGNVGRAHQVLDVSGRGRLAGCLLGVASSDKSFWVLESDETIHRDGQKGVYWQGTGLEDYFNGGWYYRTVFADPLYGLTQKRPYRTIQYRFHLSDAVSFEKVLSMSFERGPGNQSKADFDSAVFYYMEQPQAAFGEAAGVSSTAPADAFAAHTLTTRLWDYERMGDLDNARALLRYALENFGYDNAWREILALRALDYDASIDGYATVREKIEAVATGTSSAAQSAQQLKSLYEGKAVLLGLYASQPTELWLDGKRVAQAVRPELPVVVAVPMLEGKHALSARTGVARWPHWVQVSYRSVNGSGGVDQTWRKAVNPQGPWAEVSFDDSAWEAAMGLAKGPPEMEAVPYAAPGPFAQLQSAANGAVPSVKGAAEKLPFVLRKVVDFSVTPR
ncbi:MAG: hypothetical protein ACI9X0_001032 [Kiritimatiellia bacterium]|jgi:hypothetical protein